MGNHEQKNRQSCNSRAFRDSFNGVRTIHILFRYFWLEWMKSFSAWTASCLWIHRETRVSGEKNEILFYFKSFSLQHSFEILIISTRIGVFGSENFIGRMTIKSIMYYSHVRQQIKNETQFKSKTGADTLRGKRRKRVQRIKNLGNLGEHLWSSKIMGVIVFFFFFLYIFSFLFLPFLTSYSFCLSLGSL